MKGIVRLAVVGGVAALAILQMPAANADASLPYSDTSASGSVGLCDGSGHQVTSGSIDDQPFVRTAVSSVAAPPEYRVKGGKATLYAFQPRQGVPAANWSGRQLTAPSSYTNPSHPMAAFTTADEPLLTFVQAFPPQFDGLVELRLYLSAPNAPVASLSYPAANIRISGSRWTQIAPPQAACGAGEATSIESLNLPNSAFGSQAAVHPAASSTTDPSSAAQRVSGSDRGVSRTGADSGARSVLAPALVLAVLAIVAVLLSRRRRRHSASPPASEMQSERALSTTAARERG